MVRCIDGPPWAGALGQEGESELDPHTVVVVVWRHYINIEILASQLC